MLFELNEILVPQYTNIIQIFQHQKYLRLRKRIQYLGYLHPKYESNMEKVIVFPAPFFPACIFMSD